jgi:long-subunit acyl-CoA synthetase (AMP-forming)
MTSNPLPPAIVEYIYIYISESSKETGNSYLSTHTFKFSYLPRWIQRKPGSVGKPVGVELKILSLDKEEEVDEGEVCIRGPNGTSGYLNNPTANKSSFTRPGGYFRTGDRGKIDADG